MSDGPEGWYNPDTERWDAAAPTISRASSAAGKNAGKGRGVSDDTQQVIVVPRSDPIYQSYIWRQDSMTLFRLRPVLEQLRDIPNQPCRVQVGPYDCATADPQGPPPLSQWCIPCAIRQIKFELFGEEQPIGEARD